jgi:hypothetical protein
MPGGSRAQQAEAVRIVQRAKEFEDDLVVITFGQSPSIEPRTQTGEFTDFVTEVDGDASNCLQENLFRICLIIG